jgi:hypothetical protein
MCLVDETFVPDEELRWTSVEQEFTTFLTRFMGNMQVLYSLATV